MTTARAWSVITLGNDRQYGGNLGYQDDPRRAYLFDSSVANHKQLKKGDVVFVRDHRHLIGIGRIEHISEAPGEKIRQRCPVCNTVNLKSRKTVAPRWRCGNGHEFDIPSEERAEVTRYEARYERTFLPAPDAVPVVLLKAAALRPSDQVSIEEVDLAKLETALVKSYPGTRNVLAKFLQSRGPDAFDGADEDDYGSDGMFKPLMSDRRKAVLRSIRLRRGQKSFRKGLVRRYGPACMVSGCALMDIVEAAHIWPYRGDDDHHVENGLLLRADLHTLFDLDLMAIEPTTLIVRFHPSAIAAGYAGLEGTVLCDKIAAKPANEPLRSRWESYLEGLPE